MCPVSNTRLGVWDWTRSSPAAMAMHLGLPVTINTDDPILFSAGLTANLALSGLSPAQLEEARLAYPIRVPAVTPRMTMHVIYGIACAGKSTTALRLAADNGVRTIVSTDYLREVQRLYVPAAQLPRAGEKSRTPPGNFPATRRRAASSPGSPATPRQCSPPSRPSPRS